MYQTIRTRIFALLLCIAMFFAGSNIPAAFCQPQNQTTASAAESTWLFDFGAAEESGYTCVSAPKAMMHRLAMVSGTQKAYRM